jgi:glycosyltransferase involved in cell wall biosynthesis
VSKKIENLYKIDLKINPKKLITIENGIKTFDGKIDLNLRQEKRDWLISRHGLNPNLPIFLCLSRVLPLKDQKFLVEYFRDKPNYQLVIAGPASDNNYYQELQKLKSNNIFLVGSQEKVTDYNLGSDLFISASTHEGIPVAVLEAMSVETPVLVSDIPGHLTLNQYGECIATYKINDKDSFEQKLQFVLNQKDITKTQLARKVVEDHFSVKKMVDDYLLEYQK